MPPIPAEQRAAQNKSIGSHLYDVRNERKLSRKALGEIIGVCESVIADYESGKKQLTVARAAELGHVGIHAAMRYLHAQLPAEEQVLCPTNVATVHVLHKETSELSSALTGTMMSGARTPEALAKIRDEARDVRLVATAIEAGAERGLADVRAEARLAAGLVKTKPGSGIREAV